MTSRPQRQHREPPWPANQLVYSRILSCNLVYSRVISARLQGELREKHARTPAQRDESVDRLHVGEQLRRPLHRRACRARHLRETVGGVAPAE